MMREKMKSRKGLRPSGDSNLRSGSIANANLHCCAVGFLEISYEFEKIAGMRIAFRTQHPHQAFWRSPQSFAELDESHSSVDVLTKNHLCGVQFTGKHICDRLAEEGAPIFLVAQFLHDGLFEAFCKRH